VQADGQVADRLKICNNQIESEMFWRILKAWLVQPCVLMFPPETKKNCEVGWRRSPTGSRRWAMTITELLRAFALLQLAKDVASPRIPDVVPLTPQAIRNVGRRYEGGGLERALYENPPARDFVGHFFGNI
jgi:hypothetical protein